MISSIFNKISFESYSLTLIALIFCSNWKILDAPKIAVVTLGVDKVHVIASCAIEHSNFAAIFAIVLSFFKSSSIEGGFLLKLLFRYQSL